MTTAEATRASRRSKSYGYAVEVASLAELKDIFPKLRRVGSIGYSKSHADLVQDGPAVDGKPEPLRIVAHRDKRMPVLVTMSAWDLRRLLNEAELGAYDRNVVVQCKGRQASLIGRWWRELWEATR